LLVGQIAGTWSKVGQPAEALRLMREVLARVPIDNVEMRIQYAGVLLDTRQDAELSSVIRALGESGRLSAPQKEDLNKIILAYTLRQTDALREAGRFNEAYRLVRPALDQSDDPRLGMALARIYNSAGELQKALILAERVIAREPNDLDHRLFAGGMALGAKATERAAGHAAAALKIAPNDPRALTLAGRVERERGNLDKSLEYFQKAQAKERAKLSSSRLSGNLAPLQAGYLADGVSDPRFPAPLGGFSYELNKQRSGLLPIPEAAGVTALAPLSQLVMPLSQPVMPLTQPIIPLPQPVLPLLQPLEPLPVAAQGNEPERTIGEEINAVKLKLSSTIDAGAHLRLRSGESGLGSLSEVEIPIELAMPVGSNGAFTLRLTPTLLSAGALNRTDPGNTAKFGSYAMGPLVANLAPDQLQDAGGIALSVGYHDEDLTLNIGTTPLGFLVSHIVGELSMSTHLEGLTLKGTVSRRAVTDSVLSSAGMRDPLSLEVWGGVVKSGGQFGLNYGGDEGGAYINLGGATLTGKGVKDNTEFEASMGAYWRVYQASETKLKLGLNLTTLAYRENLGFFTLGHGGYFSPQQYFSLGVPWDWTGRRGSLSYQLGGEFSVQRYSQDRAPYFPNDTNLQNAWRTKAGVTYPAYYEAESNSGLGYNVYGSFEYQLTPKFVLGGRMGFDNSRNYAQQAGMLYLRYAFDGLGQALQFIPRSFAKLVP
jgi:tetratricopeptide (TPR) repeat protein